MGRLHADIFFQDRYMLNEVGVKISLFAARMLSVLWEITKSHAFLFVRKIKIMPSVFFAHAKTIQQGTTKYPIRRVVCKSFTIPRHYLDRSHEKLFSGQLPIRLVNGLETNQAFTIMQKVIRSISSILI